MIDRLRRRDWVDRAEVVVVVVTRVLRCEEASLLHIVSCECVLVLMWGHALFVIPRLLFLLLLFIYFILLSVRKKERKWRNGMKWNGGGDGVPVWEPRQACVSTVDSLCTWHTFPTCVTWFFPSFFLFSHFFFKKKKAKTGSVNPQFLKRFIRTAQGLFNLA